ncbi:glycosyltransferase family 4 protein [Novosphingobium sp. SG707]|uniref:glycosyltransferase family 4 protein n=1 Tax=Novosphingobium sp. SG707 TaxID=2586996 RepID=UPI00144669B1|nr:glycosyltransferase family 4 protein [Novosphingobium sp. SG707]NKJ00240.1 glycosyltransferase involved in cell wall biosynthesis [Novosphingobium sp. SG707]
MARADKLRVMHIITHLELGGAEDVAMQLAETLASDVESAVFAVIEKREVSAIAAHRAERMQAIDAPVFWGTRRGFKSGGVLQAAFRLVRAVERFRPDVLHVHTEIPELTLAVACVMSRAVARTPLLRTVHNSVLWIDWGRLGAWVTRWLAHGRAVAVSQAAADADQAIAAGVDRPRAEVIYNAVSISIATSAPVDRRPLRVLFAARLVHQKGADLLPAILARAQRQAGRRDVEMVIAGEGVFRDDLADAFAKQDGAWQIGLVPPIERLAEKLSNYDVMLAPSRFEGLGLLYLEALLAGVPVLAFRAPGLNEVLPPDYALAADVGDVEAMAAMLAAVVDDIAHYRQMAAACRPALLERFSTRTMTLAYLDHYRVLAGKEQGQ